MVSRYFLVLIAVALVPFVTARQNPSDKAVISRTDLPLKDELHGILPKPPLPPVKPPHCLNLPVTAQGTDIYDQLHLDHLPLCPPSPAPTPSPTPGPAPTPTPTPGPAPTPSPTPGPAHAPTPTPGPTLAPAQAPF